MSERRSARSLREQLSPLVPLLAAWAWCGLIVAIAGAQTAVPVESLLLDAQAVADVPWYTGLLSNLGILGWTVSVVAAAGAAWVARRTGRPTAARFLGLGAAATGVLLLDDLFLLHSDVLPALLGTPKVVNMAMVVAPTLLWVLTQRREIGRTRHSVLAAGFIALGFSAMSDRLLGESTSTLVLEDTEKLFGIVAWALYFTLTARDIARSTIDAAMGTDDAPKPTSPEPAQL